MAVRTNEKADKMMEIVPFEEIKLALLNGYPELEEEDLRQALEKFS